MPGVDLFKRFFGVSVDLMRYGRGRLVVWAIVHGLAVCGSAVFINELGGGGVVWLVGVGLWEMAHPCRHNSYHCYVPSPWGDSASNPNLKNEVKENLVRTESYVLPTYEIILAGRGRYSRTNRRLGSPTYEIYSE